MIKKLKKLLCVLLLISASFFLFSGCKNKQDFSGTYTYQSGSCESDTIVIKKVQGFGDKYYLVILYSKSSPGGMEFLGTISGKKIELQNGSVIIKEDKIEVMSGNKSCIYVLSN